MATSSSPTRRGLLVAAVGGVLAAAAEAIGRPLPVRAGSDGDVVLGTKNTATATTWIQDTTAGQSALFGEATGISGGLIGVGVRGDSANGYGVWGKTTGSHFFGGEGVGVQGEATSWAYGVRGVASGINSYGVRGVADEASSIGVEGTSANGLGVSGTTSGGFGVAAHAGVGGGVALECDGRVQFNRVSGVASIAAGKTSVTVTPVNANVIAGSFVLLTPKANLGSRGLWFTADTVNNRFTIHISSSRTSSTAIAYLLVG